MIPRGGHGTDSADLAHELAERARNMSQVWKQLREKEAMARRAEQEHQVNQSDDARCTPAPYVQLSQEQGEQALDSQANSCELPQCEGRKISIFDLMDEVRECPDRYDQYPLLLDPSGRAARFLRYRGRLLQALIPEDFEPENLRRGLTQCMHHGSLLVLDLHDLSEYNITDILSPFHFPEEVFDPSAIFEPAVYEAALRDYDVFMPYFSDVESATTTECFFDKFRSVNQDFAPQESFRLVVVCKGEHIPACLRGRLAVFSVEGGLQACGFDSGAPVLCVPKKDRRGIDDDLLSAAYDGDLQMVRSLVEQKANPLVTDGRGNDVLSEAAVQGHIEVARELLAFDPPLGTDPNSANSDGRTCLHRAAFHGFAAMVALLLEHGADPRLRTLSTAELAFDVSVDTQTQDVLEKWDVALTDQIKNARFEAMLAEEDRQAVEYEERKQLELRRRTRHFLTLAENGDAENLKCELVKLEKGQEVNSFRDERGNTALHLAAWRNRLQCVELLIEVGGARVNVREAKGWTPLTIAAFHGLKKMCILLMAMRSDPSIHNAYRRNAYDLAKDEEITEVLNDSSVQWALLRDVPEAAVCIEQADGDLSVSCVPRDSKSASSPTRIGVKAKAKPRAKSKARQRNSVGATTSRRTSR